jgi:H+-transporting ATPase
MFFLKLAISGHMLIYVAHTKEWWWKWLPSNGLMAATFLTMIFSSALAGTGWLMPTSIDIVQVLLVWGYAIIWMQLSELVKHLINFWENKWEWFAKIGIKKTVGVKF